MLHKKKVHVTKTKITGKNKYDKRQPILTKEMPSSPFQNPNNEVIDWKVAISSIRASPLHCKIPEE